MSEPPPPKKKSPPPRKAAPGPTNKEQGTTNAAKRPTNKVQGSGSKAPGAGRLTVQEVTAQVKARAAARAPRPLPELQDALDLLSSDLQRPPQLVHGVVHRGSKMVIGGGSKSFKTWSLVDLAVSVATGAPWWGFDTAQGRVLYMNFEIQDVFFSDRIFEVLEAKNCMLNQGQLLYWGLRGHAADLQKIMPQMIAELKERDISLIVFDPIYKGLGDRDENKAGDIASLLNEIESLAVQTGAAVAFGHHFGKGNQSGKESIDRIGGSGVFTRDPDTILTMTPHGEPDCFTVDAILRNFAPILPFVVKREHPLMVREDELDPADLKKKPGASKKFSDDEILSPLRDGTPLSKKQWFQTVHAETDISLASFNNRTKSLEAHGAVTQLGDKRTDPWVIAPSEAAA
jgi:AAA domain